MRSDIESGVSAAITGLASAIVVLALFTAAPGVVFLVDALVELEADSLGVIGPADDDREKWKANAISEAQAVLGICAEPDVEPDAEPPAGAIVVSMLPVWIPMSKRRCASGGDAMQDCARAGTAHAMHMVAIAARIAATAVIRTGTLAVNTWPPGVTVPQNRDTVTGCEGDEIIHNPHDDQDARSSRLANPAHQLTFPVPHKFFISARLLSYLPKMEAPRREQGPVDSRVTTPEVHATPNSFTPERVTLVPDQGLGIAILGVDGNGCVLGVSGPAESILGRPITMGAQVWSFVSGRSAELLRLELRGRALRPGVTSDARIDGISLAGRQIAITVSAPLSEHAIAVVTVRDLTVPRAMINQTARTMASAAVGMAAAASMHEINNVQAAMTVLVESSSLMETDGRQFQANVSRMRAESSRAAEIMTRFAQIASSVMDAPELVAPFDLDRLVHDTVRNLHPMLKACGAAWSVSSETHGEYVLGDAGRAMSALTTVLLMVAQRVRTSGQASGGVIELQTRMLDATARLTIHYNGDIALEKISYPGSVTIASDPVTVDRGVWEGIVCINAILQQFGGSADASVGAHGSIAVHLDLPLAGRTWRESGANLFETCRSEQRLLSRSRHGTRTTQGESEAYAHTSNRSALHHSASPGNFESAPPCPLPYSPDHAQSLMNDLTTCNGRTVLIVEDEHNLRYGARQVLEHYGASVLEAASGRAALDMIKDAGPYLDCILLDSRLPGINGQEVYDGMTSISPELQSRTIFMSGERPAENTPFFKLLHKSGNTFLHKPYQPSALIGAIAKIVNAHGPRGTLAQI